MANFEKLDLNPRPIYPEPSPTSAALPEVAAPSTFEVGTGSEAVRPLDSRLAVDTSDDLHENAREIAERVRDKFQVVADEARDRMNDFAGRASELADEAGQRFNDLRERLNDRLPVWKRQARERVDDARLAARRTAVQADQKARQYPIETIAAAAGAAFLIGATMRIWRSSRG